MTGPDQASRARAGRPADPNRAFRFRPRPGRGFRTPSPLFPPPGTFR